MIEGRRTAKLTAAIELAYQLGITSSHREALYQTLAELGYNWDGKSKTWSENNPWTGSAFEDAHNRPTGHIKLRIMTHPDEQEEFKNRVCQALNKHGFRITEISDPYPNRRGIGVRTYITGQKKL